VKPQNGSTASDSLSGSGCVSAAISVFSASSKWMFSAEHSSALIHPSRPAAMIVFRRARIALCERLHATAGSGRLPRLIVFTFRLANRFSGFQRFCCCGGIHSGSIIGVIIIDVCLPEPSGPMAVLVVVAWTVHRPKLWVLSRHIDDVEALHKKAELWEKRVGDASKPSIGAFPRRIKLEVRNYVVLRRTTEPRKPN